MSAANADVLEELGELIEDMTTTGKPELEEAQLKKLKSICKSSDSYINHAYHLAMTQLKKEHAEIRLSSFQIISELFVRSHAFRELLLGEFQVFLSLVVESDTKKPLPPPLSTAKILKTKAVDTIENWFQKYGSHYKKLDLGYHYLKRIKHVEFDAIRNRTLVERRQEREKEERKQRILQKKIDRVEDEIAEHLGHIELCITEMNNCFKLLLPHPEDYEVHCVEMPDNGQVTKDTISKSQSKNNTSWNSNTEENSINTNKTSMKNINAYTGATVDIGDDGGNDDDGSDHDGGVSGSNNIKNEGRSNNGNDEMDCKDDDDDENNYDDDDNGVSDDVDDNGASDDVDVSDDNENGDENDCDPEKDNLESSNESKALKDHGLGSRNYEINIKLNEMQPSIEETEDNSIVLDTTREMHKEITHKYIPMINQWLTIFTKAGYTQQRIQSVIDLKRQLVSAKEKFYELNISPSKVKESDSMNEDNSDDEEMVDVPEKEGVEYIPAENKAEYGIDPSRGLNKISALLSNLKKDEQNDEEFLKPYGFTLKDAEDPTSHARALLEVRKKHGDVLVKKQTPAIVKTAAASTSTQTTNEVDPKRKKLLDEAPIVNFDMDLYHWDDPNYEPPKIIRSHNFNNYWANKDADTEHFFEESKGSMVKRKILFSGKFEPVKWSCRAPLPSGKLCPRKDRYKCPFHGVIVARDDKGRLIVESSSAATASTSTATSAEPATSSENTETWKDLQQDIEAATGIDLNPRSRKKRKARKADDPNRKLSTKEKYARLTDINKSKKSPHSRLEKKVLHRKSLKRIAEEMDSLATKRVLDKFGDQFNYHFSK